MTSTLDTANDYLHAVALIAAELPGEWVAATGNNEWYMTATRADGLTLAFFRNGGHYTSEPAGRVEVAYTHPRLFEVKRYDQHAPRINVSLTRKPATVAADIVRRLMADTETMHAAIETQAKSADDYAAGVAANRATLRAALGWAEDDQPDADRFRLNHNAGISYGDVTVYRDSVNLDLHGVPVELAATILKLIRDAR